MDQNQVLNGQHLGVIESSPSLYTPSRSDIVKEIHKRVPLNSLGLPEGFHRSDLLHPQSGIVKKVVPQEDLMRLPSGVSLQEGVLTDNGPLIILDEKLARSAYVPLDYREGFPTVPSTGQPFWGPFEWEPPEAYKAFEQYIKQGTTEGARRLFALACDPKIHRICNLQLKAITGPSTGPSTGPNNTNQQYRPTEEEQLEANKINSQQANKKLQEWFTIYYWGPRARAHDLFYLEGIRQSQGMQALHLQNTHFKDSQALYHKIMDFIEGSPDLPGSLNDSNQPRFWTEMTPRVLTDFLKVIAQMQRVSLGLPGATPAPINSPNSAVGILHQLITGQTSSLQGNQGGGGRGRPRLYDENNDQKALQGPSQGLPPSSDSGVSDDDRARRISMIFNSAKARRDANKLSTPTEMSEAAEPAEPAEPK